MVAFPIRLLAVLLTLSSTGILPVAARFAHADCGDCVADGSSAEAGQKGCADCSPDCAVCICCPLRAVPVVKTDGPAPLVAIPQRVAVADAHQPPPGITADIFHPPRA